MEEKALIEASLGGRITADEMRAFADEMALLQGALGDAPFNVLLDYSRARSFDREAFSVLSEIKDDCLHNGAEKIVSVLGEDHLLERETSERLQPILEGREEYVTDIAAAKFGDLGRAAA